MCLLSIYLSDSLHSRVMSPVCVHRFARRRIIKTGVHNGDPPGAVVAVQTGSYQSAVPVSAPLRI